MRLAMIIPNLEDGGAQRQFALIANELSDHKGIDLFIILLGRGPHFAILGEGPRKNMYVNEFSSFSRPDAFRFVARCLRQIRPDAILSWLHPADVIVATVKWSVPRARWISAERDSSYPRRTVYRIRRLLVSMFSTAVIANSFAGREYWRSNHYRKPVFVIENIVSTARVAPTQRESSEIVVAGRLEEQKNNEIVIRCFALAVERIPELRLTFVGDGSQRDLLENLARELHVSDRVQFEGYRESILPYLDRARLLVTMSKHEGMPNVLAEAVMRGTPIVASRIPEHARILGVDYAHFADLSGSPDALAEVIWNAYSNWSHDSLRSARMQLADRTAAAASIEYVSALTTVLGREGHAPDPGESVDTMQERRNVT